MHPSRAAACSRRIGTGWLYDHVAPHPDASVSEVRADAALQFTPEMSRLLHGLFRARVFSAACRSQQNHRIRRNGTGSADRAKRREQDREHGCEPLVGNLYRPAAPVQPGWYKSHRLPDEAKSVPMSSSEVFQFDALGIRYSFVLAQEMKIVPRHPPTPLCR